jgi:hypothetical protein
MIKKLLFPALVGAMTMFASCESDPCKDLEGKCGTGTCFDGTCVCDEGYEADAAGVCNVEWPTKFLGDYLGSEVNQSTDPSIGSGTFNLTEVCVIKPVSGSTTSVRIEKLGGFDATFTANVKKANSSDASALNIEFTDVADASGDKWSGLLTYDPATKKLSGSYTLVDNFTGGSYTTTSVINYTKQ